MHSSLWALTKWIRTTPMMTVDSIHETRTLQDRAAAAAAVAPLGLRLLARVLLGELGAPHVRERGAAALAKRLERGAAGVRRRGAGGGVEEGGRRRGVALARVEAARGNLDTALQMVQGIDPAEMKSAYEEAKGDFYVQQGNADSAFTAYQAALETNQSTDSTIGSILQLKISQVQPAEQASSEAEAAEGDSQ